MILNRTEKNISFEEREELLYKINELGENME
jgi:hypothetical protein